MVCKWAETSWTGKWAVWEKEEEASNTFVLWSANGPKHLGRANGQPGKKKKKQAILLYYGLQIGAHG